MNTLCDRMGAVGNDRDEPKLFDFGLSGWNSLGSCESPVPAGGGHCASHRYLRAPMALRQLAEITDFNLFLTTSFDSLMESALNEIRRNRKKYRWPGLCVTRPRSSRQPMEAGSSMRKPQTAAAPRITSRSKPRSQFSITFSLLPTRSPSAGPQVRA